MKKILLLIMMLVVALAIFTGCGNSEEIDDKETLRTWQMLFSENGFTNEEISSYEEILRNVGIIEYKDVELFNNGRMHIVKGKIYDSDECYVHITLEDRKIIVVYLSIPAEESEAYINWRGKIKFRHEQTRKCFDLYYDMDGGYVAKLDWQNKVIEPYVE